MYDRPWLTRSQYRLLEMDKLVHKPRKYTIGGVTFNEGNEPTDPTPVPSPEKSPE